MSERPTEQFVGVDLKRRKLLKGAIALAAAFAVGKLEKLVIPKKEWWGHIEKIDEETRRMLLRFSPITVAHNANTFKKYQEAIDLGVDFVEADIRSYLGKQVIIHGQDNLALAWNEGRRLMGFSGTVPYLEELVQQANGQNQRIYLDLKEESEADIDAVARIVANHGIEDEVAYSGEWLALDRIARISRKGNNLFYSIGNEQQLYSFMDEQNSRHGQGVSLNFTLARKDVIKALRAHGVIKVFVYGADYSYEILPPLEAGADAINTGNLGALELWQKTSPDYFFA